MGSALKENPSNNNEINGIIPQITSNPEYIYAQKNNKTEVSKVKADTKEKLDGFYSETSLNKIGVSLSEAKKLAKNQGIKTENDLRHFQKDHNIEEDGVLGIESYLEMKARDIFDEFEKNPEKKEVQDKIIQIIEYGNISGSNIIYLGIKIRRFRSMHKNEVDLKGDKYYEFFKRLDKAADTSFKKKSKEIDKQFEEQGSEFRFNDVLGKKGLTGVLKGEIEASEWMDNLGKGLKEATPALKSIALAALFFSVLFGVPKEIYDNIPGFSKWYTRIPIALGLLTLGGGDLMAAGFEKNFRETTPPEETTSAVMQITGNTNSSETSEKISKITTNILAENKKLGKDKLESSKLFLLNSELTKNEKLLNKKLDDDQINITTLGITEFCNENKITEKELKKYLSLLKKQAKTGDIYFKDIFKVEEENNGTISETETVVPENKNTEVPEVIIEELTIDKLFTGLELRLNNFKKIAQKTEDLENFIGVAWGEKENIEQYKNEMNVEYSNILLIVKELKNKLAGNISEEEKNKILSELNETYLFLSEYYSGGTNYLDNDHLRDYKKSSIMAIGILVNKGLIDNEKYPDLTANSLLNNPEKFDIDLENLLEEISNNNDTQVQKAISILEDNRGIGFFDFEEEFTDKIIDNTGSTAAAIGGTAVIIMTAPGWIIGGTIALVAGTAGAAINTISRGETEGIGQLAGETAIGTVQALGAGKLALWGANAVSKSTSLGGTTGIISAEIIGDVTIVGMVPDAMKAFVFDYDYNLGESFYQNLMFAPLVLLGGGGKAIIKNLERAQLKRAIGDSSGAIENIKIFNKGISELRTNVVGKEFDIEINNNLYKVEIQGDGKIIKKTNGTDIILDSTDKEYETIINKLAIQIQEQGLAGNKYKNENGIEYTKRADGNFYNTNGVLFKGNTNELTKVLRSGIYKYNGQKYRLDENGKFYDKAGNEVKIPNIKDLKKINKIVNFELKKGTGKYKYTDEKGNTTIYTKNDNGEYIDKNGFVVKNLDESKIVESETFPYMIKQILTKKDDFDSIIAYINKNNLAGKTFDIEIDGKSYKIKEDDGKIIKIYTEGQQVILNLNKEKDVNFIKKLAIQIKEQGQNKNQTVIRNGTQTKSEKVKNLKEIKDLSIKNRENIKKGYSKAKEYWSKFDKNLHYLHIGTYLEKMPFIGKYFSNKKIKNFSIGVGLVTSYTLSNDEMWNIIDSIEDDNKDILSLENAENLGAIAGNFFFMKKLGIISSVAYHEAFKALGIKEEGFLEQII